MTCIRNNGPAFYVVQFIELPFEGIDDYVCVPSTWVIEHMAADQKAIVAYPKNEDPFDTRDRVKRIEIHDDKWTLYMAAVKYESDTYRDAEYWIATRNDYGPLVEEESKVTDTQSKFTLNKEMSSVNQSHSLKSNENPRKPLPRTSNERPALSEPKKQLDGKRFEGSKSTQSSSAVVNDTNGEPGCSEGSEQSIIIQGNQSMETPPPVLTKVLTSIRQALITTHKEYLLNEQQFQASQSETVLDNGSFDARKANECMEEKPVSPYPDNEISKDEAPAGTTNNVYCTGIASGRNFADRPTAVQNSTNHQTQMLDNFATLFTQMDSTLRNDMHNTLRNSIRETAETYKNLLGEVERFNTLANAANNPSPSNNLTQEIPQAAEERHTEVTARENSSNQDQDINDVAN